MAESRGKVSAANMADNHGSCRGSYGLFQIGCFWFPFYGYSAADHYNPEVGLDIAQKIVKRQGGYNAWSTYTNGKYKEFL